MTQILVSCKHCALVRGDLRTAIHRANGQVMRYGSADTTLIARLKAEAASCRHCDGTGRVPGRALPPGRPAKVEQPKPPKAATVIDPDVVAAALQEAAEQVMRKEAARSSRDRLTVPERRQVTGYCHECQKQIVWGRIFCGACAAARDTGGVKRAAS